MKNWTKLFILASSFVVMILSGISYYTGMFGAHFFLLEARFENLPGWKQDNQAEALKAFLRSCYAIEKLKPKATFGSLPRGGDAAAWQTICQAAHKLTVADSDTARKFFEYWFQPYRIENNFNPKGIFTGYYLPLVHASLKKDKHFTVPIYALPNDLVKINLGSFHPELLGKTIVGKLENNLLKTYPDRSAIMAGALQNKARILAWSDNPVDLFFAQIQGSAILQLANQKKIMIGYAGDNGFKYTSIGKILVMKHALTKQTVSMQSIRDWLTQHPDQVQSILNQDASYVFFNLLSKSDVYGAEHVPLTPRRSLAVDKHFIPLGAPVWLDTSIPQPSEPKVTPFRQLLIAQDVGGAIKGIVRGDVFWGAGSDAEYIAGHMQNRGQYWVLLPRVTA